jgi:hypothetical protein
MAVCISSQTPFLPRKLVSHNEQAVLQEHLFEPKVAVISLVRRTISTMRRPETQSLSEKDDGGTIVIVF